MELVIFCEGLIIYPPKNSDFLKKMKNFLERKPEHKNDMVMTMSKITFKQKVMHTRNGKIKAEKNQNSRSMRMEELQLLIIIFPKIRSARVLEVNRIME